PDHRHLRKRIGRRSERHERHQSRTRQDSRSAPEFRRYGGTRSLPSHELQERRRSNSIPRLDQNQQRARRTDAKPKPGANRNSARAEYLFLRASLQRLLREPRSPTREHYLLRLHQLRSLSRRRQPRRHRPLLPREDRNFARLQSHPGETSQETAKRYFLPHVRRAFESLG